MMKPRSLRRLIILVLHGALILNHVPSTSGGVPKIDPELQKKIDPAPAGSAWDIIIDFKKDPNLDKELAAIASNTQEESHMKAYQGMVLMKKYAEEIQGKVKAEVQMYQNTHPTTTNKLKMETFFLNGDLGIFKAPKELINQLGENEKPENANITRIMSDEIFYSTPPPQSKKSGKGEEPLRTVEESGGGGKVPLKQAWGIKKINAPAWWDANYNGTGVIVGHMDTGVDSRHPSLKWNWLGKGIGWLDADPEGVNNTFPYEHDRSTSHGTHTLGTIIGRGLPKGSGPVTKESDVNPFGVGIAPGARWISCLACRHNNGSCAKLLQIKCLDFLYCPDPKTKCRYRPNVISISISCDQDPTKKCFQGTDQRLAKFNQYEVIIVVGAGNNGKKGCGTIGTPADLPFVIAVGNVDKKDVLDKTSSKGPAIHRFNSFYQTFNDTFKPDIVAPGTDIYSTVHTGKSAGFEFDYRTGTSCATPQVAGAVALLLSRTRNMTIAQVKQALFNHTVSNAVLESQNRKERCGGYKDTDEKGNHKFGHGRLKLPDPNDPRLPPPLAPNRPMPPPPDYSDLDGNSTPPSVRPGMVGVVIIMTVIAFLMNAEGMEI